jgi:hypothetical protein
LIVIVKHDTLYSRIVITDLSIAFKEMLKHSVDLIIRIFKVIYLSQHLNL